MRHLLLALSVVLLGVSWGAAQNASSPSQTKAESTGSQMIVQGCLSSSDGNYMLTDKNGNTFRLSGEATKLSEHIGHEVRITGTLSSASASSGGGNTSSTMGQTDASQEVLEVNSLKHIAKTCTTSGASR